MFEASALSPQMQRSDFHDGGWVVPKVQDRARLNKPPLIYWMQVASAWIFTGGDPLADEIWMYRIPSVLCSTFAVLLTWWVGRSMFDPRVAWLASALLAICPVVVFDAHQARADQLLLATVVGMQGCLWGVWKSTARGRLLSTQAETPGSHRVGRSRWGCAIGFWLFLALAVLAKGPIGPMIALLTCAALSIFTRRWSWMLRLRPLIGVLTLAALVGPWVWMVGEHVGWTKYIAIVYDETIGRSAEAKEGHWAPPGYHTVLLAVLFWPGSKMTALGFKVAWMRAIRGNAIKSGTVAARLASWWRSRGEGRAAELFCIAWILPSWLVFECIGTKLPHYTLPMYPAIALLSARMLLRVAARGNREQFSRLDRAGFGAWWLLGLILVLGVALALNFLWLTSQGSVASQVPLVLAVAAAIALLVAMYRIRPGAGMQGNLRRFGAMAMVWCAAVGLFMTFIAHKALPGNMTPRLMAIVRDGSSPGSPIASEYHEDSLIFATRGRVERLDRAHMQDWLDAGEGRVAIVRRDGTPFFDMDSAGLPAHVAAPYRSLGELGMFPGSSWVVLVKQRDQTRHEGVGSP